MSGIVDYAMSRHSRMLVAVLLAVGIAAVAQADGRDETLGVSSSVVLPPQAKGKPPSWTGKAFRQGVVSVANPYGAEAGAKILEQGGNAIDAAVAIAYALNVVEPQSAGIGGGGFMMIHLAKTGETVRDRLARERRLPALRRPCSQGRSFTPALDLRAWRSACRAWCVARRWRCENWGTPRLGEGAAAGDRAGRRRLRRDAALCRSASCSSAAAAQNSPGVRGYFCPGGTSRVAVGDAGARTSRWPRPCARSRARPGLLLQRRQGSRHRAASSRARSAFRDLIRAARAAA